MPWTYLDRRAKLGDMNEERKVALVAGANGVIGKNLIAHLETQPGWRVIGLSRRGGPGQIAVDLLDADDTRAKLGGLADVTHVFYALMSTSRPGPNWSRRTWRC